MRIQATAGGANKHSQLLRLGVSGRAFSRDASTFVYGLSQNLRGQRQHATLAALSQDFIATSLALMGEASTYLEVGKNNIWNDARMAASASCSPLRLVAADYQSSTWVWSALCELSKRVDVGEVHPLPLTVRAV